MVEDPSRVPKNIDEIFTYFSRMSKSNGAPADIRLNL